jgi:hypothetical protein
MFSSKLTNHITSDFGASLPLSGLPDYILIMLCKDIWNQQNFIPKWMS